MRKIRKNTNKNKKTDDQAQQESQQEDTQIQSPPSCHEHSHQDIEKQTADICVKESYSTRGLHKCLFCGFGYNVGERIPRIIVGCGHTFCTSCLSYFIRRSNIRCPLCRKVLKHVESVDKLPLNFNILYEIVVNDEILRDINFDEATNEDGQIDDEYLCKKHGDRVNHFYCSEHQTIFCRECIKEVHNEDKCFVVDLYEIEKMKQLQLSNMKLNQKQIQKKDKPWVIKDEPVKPKKRQNRDKDQKNRQTNNQQRGRDMQKRAEMQTVEHPDDLNLDVDIENDLKNIKEGVQESRIYQEITEQYQLAQKKSTKDVNGPEDAYLKCDQIDSINNNRHMNEAEAQDDLKLKQLELEQAKRLLKESLQTKNTNMLFDKLESNEQEDLSYGSQGEGESYYDDEDGEEREGEEDSSQESGELSADALKKAKEELKRQLKAELSGKKPTQKSTQDFDSQNKSKDNFAVSQSAIEGEDSPVPANLKDIEVLEYEQQ